MAKNLPDNFLDTVTELHSAGLTNPQIAGETGVTLPTVAKALAELGIIKNTKQNKLDAVDEQEFILWYFDDNKPIHEIRAHFGLHSVEIYTYLRKINRKPRSQSSQKAEETKDMLDHAIKLYQERLDMTIIDICAETGVHQPRLHQELRSREIPFRRPSMARDSRWYD